jgi:hypothetical protein
MWECWPQANYITFFTSSLTEEQHKLCGLYYKHVTIVNDDSSIVSKWSIKLIDDPSVIIYDRHRFLIQATDVGQVEKAGRDNIMLTNVTDWCCLKYVGVLVPGKLYNFFYFFPDGGAT